MVNMTIPQPAVNNAAAANAKSITKDVVKSTDNNGDTPQKSFNDLFQEASNEAEVKTDSVSEKTADQMPGFSGANNVVVLVDVSAIPIVQIEAETEMSLTINVPTNPDLSMLAPEVNSAMVQKGFADLLQNAKNPNLIKSPAFTENVQPEEIPMAQHKGSTSSAALTEQALLNLLNGKSIQNTAVLAQMTNQQQALIQNQPQVQMANQQQAVIQNQPQVQMVNQQQAVIQNQLQAETINQQPTEVQSRLPVQPVLETQQAVNKPVKAKETDKPSPIVQNVNLVIEENGNRKDGQLSTTAGLEKKAMPENTLAPMPNKNEAILQGTATETANKGGESANPQQFGQFVTSIMHNVRTENALPAQPTMPQTPESLAKYDIHGQIIEQARLVKTNENTQMIIKLRPDHLGELTLKVSVEHGVVNATFHSDNAQVRTMLETSMLQLKQELISQGIKVDNVGVYAGLGQFLSDGQGGQSGREQQSTKFKNRKIDLADFEDEVDKVSGLRTSNTATEDGVDYRI